MTPQEFLADKLGIGSNAEQDNQIYEINKALYELVSDYRNVKYVQSLFLDYARIMCQKQKEICAEEAKDCKYGFYEDLALNSPFPIELQYEI